MPHAGRAPLMRCAAAAAPMLAGSAIVVGSVGLSVAVVVDVVRSGKPGGLLVIPLFLLAPFLVGVLLASAGRAAVRWGNGDPAAAASLAVLVAAVVTAANSQWYGKDLPFRTRDCLTNCQVSIGTPGLPEWNVWRYAAVAVAGLALVSFVASLLLLRRRGVAVGLAAGAVALVGVVAVLSLAHADASARRTRRACAVMLAHEAGEPQPGDVDGTPPPPPKYLERCRDPRPHSKG